MSGPRENCETVCHQVTDQKGHTMVEVEGVSKSFGIRKALQDIDLSVAAGECVTVFGPNGAGKSTLVQILGGVMRPTRGHIRIDGISTKDDPIETRRRLGLVAHQPLLYEELSAVENLTFFGRMFDVPHAAARIDDVLRQVGLELRAHDPVRTFSRGMIQRLAIARALVHRPKVLLLDEPYTGLDRRGSAIFGDIVRDVSTNGGTIIVATHDVNRGLQFCHRAVILVGGRIVCEATEEDIEPAQFEGLYGRCVDGGRDALH